MSGQQAGSTAVIGAGIAGLTAAYRLASAGRAVDVYERWPGLGGQVATMPIEGGDRLEHYYHHLFTSDREIQDLYSELGMDGEIGWYDSSVAVFSEGRIHPFTTPLDLLRFKPLPVHARVRTGLAALRSGSIDPQSVAHVTTKDWVIEKMGKAPWQTIWGPLLRGKFGDRAEEISAAWLVCKLGLRRQVSGSETRQEVLGYPSGGWQPLLDRLVTEIEASGGRVLIDRPVKLIERHGEKLELTLGAADSFRRGLDPREFEPGGDPTSYDDVLATVPNDVFLAMIGPGLSDELETDQVKRIESIDYQTALCLILELDRGFADHYWTNIADPALPFVGLIEHELLVGRERYGGRRFLYVANYLDPSSELLGLDPEQLIERYTEGLRAINPAFDPSWVINRWRFAEPAAQPIVTCDYQDRIPSHRQGKGDLWLANTTQIYPEDRGTNYSVRLGSQIAAEILAGGPEQ